MQAGIRTFRVFVSSTFEDLKEERDALAGADGPFSALAELCASHGARFQAVDLRWGVAEDAARDQQTMEICLAEIERCQRTGIKPNFIVLLGSRYGWRPLPARIDSREFEVVHRHIDAEADALLVADWYQRDDNAVPPQFLLKPRRGEFEDPVRWSALEARLHGVLQQAARRAGLPAEALARYEASATHQEILKGLGTNTPDREHVFAFLRESSEAVTDLELQGLKRFLRAELGHNVSSYRKGDLRGLCEEVELRLRTVILKQVADLESRSALAIEIEAHEAFAAECVRHFSGRSAELDAIATHVDGKGPHSLLVLSGAQGAGMSAIVAKATNLAAERLPGAVIVRRFIGTSPDSSDGSTLLRGLCQEIAQRYGRPDDVPSGFNELVGTFLERLALTTPERPLVLAVDSVDRLDPNDRAASLTWLPARVPTHCRILLSTAHDLPALNNAQLVEVGLFPIAAAEEALSGWLDDAKRTLTSEQRQQVIGSFQHSGLPLHLKLAFEEARCWRSFDQPARCTLPDRPDGIVDALFARLAQSAHHGPVFIRRSLSYLAASRYGLTEDEILDVLTADDIVWEDFRRRAKHDPGRRRLPSIVWSRLFHDLAPYLTERSVPGGTAITFAHRQMSDRVRTLYAADDASWHSRLAGYFESIGRGPRAVVELPWQLARAGQFQRLHDLLLDGDFFPLMLGETGGDFFTSWSTIEKNTTWRMGPSYDEALPRLFNPDRAAGASRTVPVSHLLGLGEALIDGGCRLPARRIFTTLVRLLRTRQEPELLAGALLGLVNTVEIDPATGATSELQAAVQLLQEAEGLFRSVGNQKGVAECRLILSQLQRSAGRDDESRRLMVEADTTSVHDSDQGTVLNEKALLLCDEGRYSEAIEFLLQARRRFVHEGDKQGVAVCLGNTAKVLRKQGDTQGALAALEEQEQICRELGLTEELANSLWGQALITAEEGRDPLAAYPLLASAIRVAHEHGRGKMERFLEGYRRGKLVVLLSQQAERLVRERAFEAVGNIHGHVATISRDSGNWEDLASALANQALVLGRHLGRTREARSLIAEALSVARDHRLRHLIATLEGLKKEL